MKNGEEYNKRVGQRVKAIREKKGISQMDLLKVLGSKSTEADDESGKLPNANYISMIENGRRGLTTKNINKICEAYGVSPDYLMLRSDYMTDAERAKAVLVSLNKDNSIESDFFDLIAAQSGYRLVKVGEWEKQDVSSIQKIVSCMLKNSEGDEICLTIGDVNEFISDIEEYASMRFRRLVKRKSFSLDDRSK